MAISVSSQEKVLSQNKATIQRLYDQFINNGDLDVFEELVAEDVVEHEEFPGLSSDREGVRQFFEMIRTAFPDLTFQVEDMAAEDDKVFSRIRVQGTHRGEFMDIPATGKRVDVSAMDSFRLENGQIKEHWGVTDSLGMMQQLGAVSGLG